MHVVFRLGDEPLVLFDETCSSASSPFLDAVTPRLSLGHAILGGARSRAYVKESSNLGASVGAVLVPGASRSLFGARVDELAERHLSLEDLWGNRARGLRARLLEETSLARRLVVFESALEAELPGVHAVHPAIAEALARFEANPSTSVSSIVAQSGYSHRGFVALFRGHVGLGPKTFARVARFQHALALVARTSQGADARLALEAGYADQSHFSREFRELSGVSPAEYRTLRPASPNHVPFVPRDWPPVADGRPKRSRDSHR